MGWPEGFIATGSTVAAVELAASLFGEGSASKIMRERPFNGLFTCYSLPACTALVLPSGFSNSHDRFCELYQMTAAALRRRNSPGWTSARPRSPPATG